MDANFHRMKQPIILQLPTLPVEKMLLYQRITPDTHSWKERKGKYQNKCIKIIIITNLNHLLKSTIVQFRIYQNRWIKMKKTDLYRVNLNLKHSGENSHPSVCCVLLLINTFLLVFVNIFLQLEANPVQMRLLYYYPAVLVNLKLDYYKSIFLHLHHTELWNHPWSLFLPLENDKVACLGPHTQNVLVTRDANEETNKNIAFLIKQDGWYFCSWFNGELVNKFCHWNFYPHLGVFQKNREHLFNYWPRPRAWH